MSKEFKNKVATYSKLLREYYKTEDQSKKLVLKAGLEAPFKSLMDCYFKIGDDEDTELLNDFMYSGLDEHYSEEVD